MLIGLPGAGKSTLAREVERRGGDAWCRVSQDVLGTLEKCVESAKASLAKGVSVVVDRTHVSKDSRATFVQVGREAGVPVHAVVLTVDADTCKARKMEMLKSAHEAGAVGARMMPIITVSGMRLEAEPPTKDEGFASVSYMETTHGPKESEPLMVALGFTDGPSSPIEKPPKRRRLLTRADPPEPTSKPVEQASSEAAPEFGVNVSCCRKVDDAAAPSQVSAGRFSRLGVSPRRTATVQEQRHHAAVAGA